MRCWQFSQLPDSVLKLSKCWRLWLTADASLTLSPSERWQSGALLRSKLNLCKLGSRSLSPTCRYIVAQDLPGANGVLQRCKSAGILPDQRMYKDIIDFCIRSADFDRATELISDMVRPWLITGLAICRMLVIKEDCIWINIRTLQCPSCAGGCRVCSEPQRVQRNSLQVRGAAAAHDQCSATVSTVSWRPQIHTSSTDTREDCRRGGAF